MNLSIFTTVIILSQSLLAGSNINRVVGDNDLVAVDATASNIPFKYRSLVDAIGLLSNGCTATHIGGGYVLSAAHCFFAGPDLKRNLNCSQVRIEWGVREGLTPYMVSTCESISAIQLNAKVDFALLKVSPAPAAAVGVDFTNKAIPGDVITIFSHPDEQPLHWSKTCLVEDGAGHPKLPAGSLNHICDTNQGSSGALLINTTTLKAVGIHGGGRSDTAGTMNYGTHLADSEIADILKELGFK